MIKLDLVCATVELFEVDNLVLKAKISLNPELLCFCSSSDDFQTSGQETYEGSDRSGVAGGFWGLQPFSPDEYEPR